MAPGLAVYVSPMTDLDDENLGGQVVDPVKDAMVANAYAKITLRPVKLL